MYIFRWNVVFLAMLTVGLFAPWTLSQRPEGRRGDAFSKPPTNLKILEVDDPEDLRPIMRSFSASLGVNCRFCHDTQDWAKDIPHKETARSMIEMVREINTKVFTWERAPRATCHMCHNGNVYPKFDPPSEE